MKKLWLAAIAAMLIGCGRSASEIQVNIDRLLAKERQVKARLLQVEQDTEKKIREMEARKIEVAEKTGHARYLIALTVRPHSFTLDLDQHIKDAANAFSFWIPVDKQLYNDVEIGTELKDSFRSGSFWISGKLGGVRIKVTDKKKVAE